MPPFQLVGITLLIGAVPGLKHFRAFTRDARTLAVGVTGLFGYHFCLFMAFRLTDPVAANLMNYLWPALIVLLSPLLLKGYRLRWFHVTGGLFAFTGAVLLVTGGALQTGAPKGAAGLLLALVAALIWSSYSVLTKRLPPFSTASVSQFCALAGGLALGVHGLIEPATTLNAATWGWLVALGLGPMGLAFYAWDAALNAGDPRAIGALSYLTPMLSTLALVWLGSKPFTGLLAVAMALIVGGALIGSLDRLGSEKFFRKLATTIGE